MPRQDRHTRLVSLLKVVLPLSALVLLATLFIFSDRIDPDSAIRWAEVDVEERARDPRMTAPEWSGVTSDGTAVTVMANTARPGIAGGRDPQADGLIARFDMPEGGNTQIVANSGQLTENGSLLALDGAVQIRTSSGYVIDTETLSARLDRSGVQSHTPVVAIAPMGEIRAERFTLAPQFPATGGDSSPETAAPQYVLLFSGQVKLLYQPGG